MFLTGRGNKKEARKMNYLLPGVVVSMALSKKDVQLAVLQESLHKQKSPFLHYTKILLPCYDRQRTSITLFLYIKHKYNCELLCHYS